MPARKGTKRRYSKGASKKVGRAMHERKAGTLRSGRSKKKVKSKKQAVAIGLSEARREGKKVPAKKSSKKSSKKGSARKAGGSRKATRKAGSSRKKTTSGRKAGARKTSRTRKR
jgi:hypothetical protein